MLVSSSKYLGMLLTFFALTLLFLTRRHAADTSLGQAEMGSAYEPSDQTVIGGGMTEPQETVVYDKLSGNTPSDIEANWLATIGAKSLLQEVREFRASTQASYNDASKKSVRRTLEDAELELEKLGKESFNTKKIVQGVQKLKVALKAAEEAIARGPDSKAMTSKSGTGLKATAQVDEGLQRAEGDRTSKEKAERAEHNAAITDSQSEEISQNMVGRYLRGTMRVSGQAL